MTPFASSPIQGGNSTPSLPPSIPQEVKGKENLLTTLNGVFPGLEMGKTHPIDRKNISASTTESKKFSANVKSFAEAVKAKLPNMRQLGNLLKAQKQESAAPHTPAADKSLSPQSKKVTFADEHGKDLASYSPHSAVIRENDNESLGETSELSRDIEDLPEYKVSEDNSTITAEDLKDVDLEAFNRELEGLETLSSPSDRVYNDEQADEIIREQQAKNSEAIASARQAGEIKEMPVIEDQGLNELDEMLRSLADISATDMTGAAHQIEVENKVSEKASQLLSLSFMGKSTIDEFRESSRPAEELSQAPKELETTPLSNEELRNWRKERRAEARDERLSASSESLRSETASVSEQKVDAHVRKFSAQSLSSSVSNKISKIKNTAANTLKRARSEEKESVEKEVSTARTSLPGRAKRRQSEGTKSVEILAYGIPKNDSLDNYATLLGINKEDLKLTALTPEQLKAMPRVDNSMKLDQEGVPNSFRLISLTKEIKLGDVGNLTPLQQREKRDVILSEIAKIINKEFVDQGREKDLIAFLIPVDITQGSSSPLEAVGFPQVKREDARIAADDFLLDLQDAKVIQDHFVPTNV